MSTCESTTVRTGKDGTCEIHHSQFFIGVSMSFISHAAAQGSQKGRSVKVRGNSKVKKQPTGNSQRKKKNQGAVTIGVDGHTCQITVGAVPIPKLRRGTHTREVRAPGRTGPHIIEFELPLPIPESIRTLSTAQNGKPDKTAISIAYVPSGQMLCSNQYTGCWPSRLVETFNTAESEPHVVYRWLCDGEIRVGGPNAKPSCG